MKTTRLLTLLLTAGLLAASCGEDSNEYQGKANDGKTQTVVNGNCNDASREPALSRLEFPKVKTGSSVVVIHRTSDGDINYSVEWDYVKKSQRWSCYQMHAGNRRQSGVSRYYPDRNDPTQVQYPFDPDLDWLSPNYYFDSDLFYGSNYDHGHICPSADRLNSTEANYQTFYLTNMQPQRNVFNAGLWEKMESKMRDWAPTSGHDTLFVCKGGTIDTEDQIRGLIKGQMIIPRYFFMALLYKESANTTSPYRALGFWAEHLDYDHSNDALGDYVVNIRQLEQLTGIDFFCNLPDDVEKTVETLSAESIKRIWGIR